MSFSILAQTVALDAVADIKVTEIVEDGGQYVRRLRVWAAPYVAGDLPALDVVLKAEDAEALKIVIPESSF